MYLKSLKIKTDKLGSNHTSAADTYNNLALLKKIQKKWNNLEELWKKHIIC